MQPMRPSVTTGAEKGSRHNAMQQARPVSLPTIQTCQDLSDSRASCTATSPRRRAAAAAPPHADNAGQHAALAGALDATAAGKQPSTSVAASAPASSHLASPFEAASLASQVGNQYTSAPPVCQGTISDAQFQSALLAQIGSAMAQPPLPYPSIQCNPGLITVQTSQWPMPPGAGAGLQSGSLHSASGSLMHTLPSLPSSGLPSLASASTSVRLPSLGSSALSSLLPAPSAEPLSSMPALFEGQAYLTTSTAFAAAGSTGPSAFPVGAPGFPTARSAGQAAYNPAGSATFNGAGSAGQSAFAAAGSAPQTAFNRSGLAAFNPAGSAGQPAFVAAGIGFGVPLAAGSAFPTPFMQPDYTLLPSNPQQPASAAAALAASVGFLVPPVKLEVKPSSGSSALSAGQSGPPPSGGLDPNSEDDVSQGAPPQGELWTNAESLTEREPEASGSAGPEQLTLSDLRNLKARGSIRSSQMCQEALKSLETTNALVQAAKDAFAPQVPGGTSQASGRSTRSGSAGTKRQMAAEKAAAEKVAADQRRMGRPVAYEGDPDSSQLTAEERRRIRRRINNRESARRVREKRQEIMDRITEQMRALEGDKAKLVKYVGEVEDTCRAMTDEMRRVKERWCQSCIENVKLYKEVFELRKRLQAVTGEPQGNLLEVSAAPQMPTGTDSPFAQPTASLANLRPPQLSSVESINLDEWLKVEFSGA